VKKRPGLHGHTGNVGFYIRFRKKKKKPCKAKIGHKKKKPQKKQKRGGSLVVIPQKKSPTVPRSLSTDCYGWGIFLGGKKNIYVSFTGQFNLLVDNLLRPSALIIQ